MYSTALLDGGRDRFLDDRTRLKMMIWDRDSNVERNSTPARCMKIAFSIASEPSYVYILSGSNSVTRYISFKIGKKSRKIPKFKNSNAIFFGNFQKKSKKQNKTCRTAIAKLCRGQKCKNVMSPFVLPYLFSYFSQCKITLRKSLRCIQYSFAKKIWFHATP